MNSLGTEDVKRIESVQCHVEIALDADKLF